MSYFDAITIIDEEGDIVTVDPSDADAVSGALKSLNTNGRMYAFNGSTWDRVRVAKTDGSNLGTVGVPAAAQLLYDDGVGYLTDRTARSLPDANGGLNFGTTALMGYNGTAWDRLRSSITNGLEVDVTRLRLGGTEISEANPTPTLTGSEKWESLKTLTAYGPGLDFTINNDSPLTSVYEYHGMATRGTATSANSWDIMRLEFTNVDKEVIVQILVNEDMAWDDRVAGGTQGWTA